MNDLLMFLGFDDRHMYGLTMLVVKSLSRLKMTHILKNIVTENIYKPVENAISMAPIRIRTIV